MQSMVPLYGFSGGSGKTGGVLTVTAPAGVTVTAGKDGKSMSKISGADGLAVFQGLESGVWTVTITDGERTAEKTVTITADFAVELTFFAATIHLTYPAGSNCIANCGDLSFAAPDTSGTWDCVVPKVGTWTFIASSGGKLAQDTVTIAQEGQEESLTLSFTLYLYNLGDENEEETGGWKGENRMTSSNVGTFAKGTDSLSSKNVSGATYGQTMVDAVDFTRYSTLHALVKTSTASVVVEMAVADDFPEDDTSIPLTSGTIGTTQTEMTLDISVVNDFKKVHLRAKSTTAYLYTYKVWLT